MSNVEGTIVNEEVFEILNSNNAQIEGQDCSGTNSAEFLKIELQKYRQYKIVLEGIEECLEDDNNLDEELKNKVKHIILDGSVSQIRLSDKATQETSESVLGVTLGTTELTYSESDRLISCLKSKLDKKHSKLKSDCFSLLRKDISEISTEKNKLTLDLSTDDAILLEYRNKLTLEQECYVKNQLEILELLEELKNIRLKTVPELTNKKIQECSLRSKINHLKSLVAKDKCRIDIFMERSNSLKAYSEIINDLKEQQEELKHAIEHLKELKKKYEQVSCKEYDDILRSYLQYKSSLEKKKMMYELFG